jgi:hypothetical protein
MGTVIIALVLVGFIALVFGLLMFVNKRDQRREAAKSNETV